MADSISEQSSRLLSQIGPRSIPGVFGGNVAGSIRFRLLVVLPALCFAAGLTGCSREWYREQADCEVEQLIEEKSSNRWSHQYRGVEMDPRSRFHDPYDPVRPPMPPDDPESHQLMHHVDGKDGWDQWHDNGNIEQLENPDWKQLLDDYVERDADGNIKLTLDEAVRLALIHSPSWQQQVEELYLSALDVSTERFSFETQFLGGLTSGVPGRSRSVWNDTGAAISESRTVTGTDSRLRFRQNLTSAGQMIVELTNTLTWQLSGGESFVGASGLGFTFIQPLLRAAGRQIALEQLTLAERALLSNLRAFEHYRQGFYTQIAIGDNGTSQPNRRGGFSGGSGLSGFSGQGSGGFGGIGDVSGFGGRSSGSGGGDGGAGVTGSGLAGGGAGQVGGFIGLLQQDQQIRNTSNSLNAQQQMLQMLEAHLEAGLIDIAQVDQFRQSIETERANLLQSRNGFENGLEAFKTFTLGLPPDMGIKLDGSLIEQFKFLDPELDTVQSELGSVVSDFGALGDAPTVEQLRSILERLTNLSTRIREQIESIRSETEALVDIREMRFPMDADAGRTTFDGDRKRLLDTLAILSRRFEAAREELNGLTGKLSEEQRGETGSSLIGINVELTNLVGELVLVQARGRLERVTLDSISLTSQEALEIARANRLDWMNNRASLVDNWRLIEFNANDLESSLDVEFGGDLDLRQNTARGSQRTKDGTLTARLAFDAPVNRRVERNDFRQQLIFYQRFRRNMIQYEDGVHRGLRSLLRELKQHQVNLEIQRRAVAISIRRVDQTRENLNRPTPPALPGAAPAQFGPTAALNLLTALSDLRSSQNNFMSVWLNYYAARVRLMRELGIMRINEEGMWIDESIEDALRATAEEQPLPPAVPGEWFDQLDSEDGESTSNDGEPEDAEPENAESKKEAAARVPPGKPILLPVPGVSSLPQAGVPHLRPTLVEPRRLGSSAVGPTVRHVSAQRPMREARKSKSGWQPTRAD